jgi:chorismate dehydratase
LPEALRCGRIVYTNDLPIYAAFDEGALPFEGMFVEDVPSRLNARMGVGDLDLSPVSAAYYARHSDDLVLLDGLCIGARREVWSVVLLSQVAPALLGGTEVAATRESASGRALLQILLERRYGVAASFAAHDDPLGAYRLRQPALLIGDAAIDARCSLDPAHVHDLGLLWHEWTGGDMVFAVWVASRARYERMQTEIDIAMASLRAGLDWGLGHPERVIARAESVRPRAAGFYADYFATLNYSFDAAAHAGFERFRGELDAVGLGRAAAAAVRAGV